MVPEYNFDNLCAPVFYKNKAVLNPKPFCKPEEDWISVDEIDPSQIITDTYFHTSAHFESYIDSIDDIHSYNIAYYFGKSAIEMYQKASSWFKELFTNQTAKWNEIIKADINAYDAEDESGKNQYESSWFADGSEEQSNKVNVNPELSSDNRWQLLSFLGDKILEQEFQNNIARYAVLRKNLYLLYEGYLRVNKMLANLDEATQDANKDKLAEIELFIANLKTLIEDVSRGEMIPLLKLVSSGTARSLGNSQVSIKFNENLVNYLNLGTPSLDAIIKYYNRFPNKASLSSDGKYSYEKPSQSQIIGTAQQYRSDPEPNSIKNINKYVADFFLRANAQLYLYGANFKSQILNATGLER